MNHLQFAVVFLIMGIASSARLATFIPALFKSQDLIDEVFVVILVLIVLTTAGTSLWAISELGVTIRAD